MQIAGISGNAKMCDPAPTAPKMVIIIRDNDNYGDNYGDNYTNY